MKLRVDINELTYGDAVDLEEAGFPLAKVQELMAAGEVPVRLAVVLIWIVRRKQEPMFTLADAMAMPMNEPLEVDVVEGDSPKGSGPDGDSPGSASGPGGPPTR